MIKTFIFLFLLVSTANAAKITKSEPNTLEIKNQKGIVEIFLPKLAFKALTQWNPEFIVFNRTDYSKSVLEMFETNENPMVFIDDLDGNNKKDIVLFGADLHNQYVIALLQQDKKWILIEVAAWSMKNIKKTELPVMLEESGTTTINSKNQPKETGIPIYILPAEGEHAIKLKKKKKVGIQVERFLGDGDVYEIKNNKSVKFAL